MARGRAFLKQAQQSRPSEADGPYCPLCIEVLDSHEQGWYPCQCGYQVCAFCYQRLQLENNRQCPGCRTVYGAVPPEIAEKESQILISPPHDTHNSTSGLVSAEQENVSFERVDLEKSSDGSGSQESQPKGHVADSKSHIDSSRPAWGQRSNLDQEQNAVSTSEPRPENWLRDPIVSYPWRGARQEYQNGDEDSRYSTQAGFGAAPRNSFEANSNGVSKRKPNLPEHSRELEADVSPAEAAAEDESEAPDSEQEDLWEKLLSAPRAVENAKASSLRQTISQAVSDGGLSPAEGASKLVACLQDTALNGSATSPTQAIPLRPQLTQSQPSSDFTLSPSSLPRPPPESLIRRPEVWEGNLETSVPAEPSAFGARQSDVEVPAPRKKTAVSGDEKLRSWMTEGIKVAAPVKSQATSLNGFVHASHPAVPGPSRESRFSAHGAIGDLILPPSGAHQLQHQQSNFGQAGSSNGGDSLWGPLSKQSSSSSFWGGHQLDADPVPESVQELWADKGRMESRFEFKPASLEQGRDLLASSLGRDGSLASSFGPPVNGLLNHNSLSNYSNQNPQLFPQDQALNGHAFGGNNYPGQQARMSLGANNASSLGMAGLTSMPLQNPPAHNYLQGASNRSGTPINSQTVSPSYARTFGQAGLAAGQGYSQAFPSPLSTKGLAPPGLGGRVGGGIGNAIGPSGLAQLGASGLGNHLPRSTGLNPHGKGTGVFNLPVSQPVAPRFQSQLGQGIGGLQRQPNGVSGYGNDGRHPLAGPPGQAMAPSSAAQNFGGNGLDFGALKQRQMLHEIQTQRLLQQQQQQQQPKTGPYGQQQASQPSQAQILLERREQLRQLMQQGLLDLTPQQLQQFQAQQLLMSQQQKGMQQQSLWPNRAGSPGLPQPGMMNTNAGPRLFQR